MRILRLRIQTIPKGLDRIEHRAAGLDKAVAREPGFCERFDEFVVGMFGVAFFQRVVPRPKTKRQIRNALALDNA